MKSVKQKTLVKVTFILPVLLLCSALMTHRASASWSIMNEELKIWDIWAVSDTDVFGAGCLGAMGHYDGNPEGIWEETEADYHLA